MSFIHSGHNTKGSGSSLGVGRDIIVFEQHSIDKILKIKIVYYCFACVKRLLSLSCLLYYLQKLLAVASEIQLMLRAARDRKNRRAVVISRRQHLLPAAGLTIGSFPVVHCSRPARCVHRFRRFNANSCTTNRFTLFHQSAPAAYSVRRQVPGAVFQSLATAFVLSRLDYCNSVLVTNR